MEPQPQLKRRGGTPIPVHQCQEILLRFDALRRETTEDQHGRQVARPIMQCCEQIGREMDLLPNTVWRVLQRLRPTTDMAKMYLKAKAYKLVKRLVNKAGPTEIIDILQRPGINVLEPIVKKEAGGGGFFLAVSVESCGAVKIGAGTKPEPTALPDAVVFDPFQPQENEISTPQALPISSKPATSTESVLERARRRLKAAQQEADGQVLDGVVV